MSDLTFPPPSPPLTRTDTHHDTAVLGEEETNAYQRRLHYFFTSVLGSARLACLVGTPSFPLWLLTLWIHVMELVMFNLQAQEEKKKKPLDMEQKGFLAVIWVLPIVQLLTRDYQ